MKESKMLENTASSSIAAKKEMFLKFQKERESKNKDRITPRDRKGLIPVSCIQEGTLLPVINKYYDPEEIRSSGPALGYLIKGRVNISAFHRAIQEVVKRHEILRTNYEAVDNKPYQKINEVPANILKVIDLNELSEDEKKDELKRVADKRASESFSFFKDPLMITFTLITAKDEHALYIFTHHIATDGISMGILQSELLTLYHAYALNISIPLPELALQYGDYAIWEQERYSGDFLEEKLGYWKQLTDKINTFLPFDHAIESFSYDGDTVPIIILPEIVKRLIVLCNENNTTMFTVLYAAFMAMVYIFSGNKYNFFSFIVANRNQKETEPLIGCFMTWQFFHIDLSGDPTFIEVIERTKNTLLKVYDNFVPFLHVSKTIPPQGPVVNFQLQTFWEGGAKAPERTSEEKPSQQVSKTEEKSTTSRTMPPPMMFIPIKVEQPPFAIFPFEVMLSEAADTINGSFTFNKTFYNRSTIVNLTNDYVILISQVLKKPDIRLSELKMKPHRSIIKENTL
jgi:hypothetical protein